ncbi:hypothetical protein ACOSQ2_013537 [Xanthoceras sorbifolium]
MSSTETKASFFYGDVIVGGLRQLGKESASRDATVNPQKTFHYRQDQTKKPSGKRGQETNKDGKVSHQELFASKK